MVPCSHPMVEMVKSVLWFLGSLFKPRSRLVAEVLVLRHQLDVLHRKSPGRGRLSAVDRPAVGGNSKVSAADGINGRHNRLSPIVLALQLFGFTLACFQIFSTGSPSR